MSNSGQSVAKKEDNKNLDLTYVKSNTLVHAKGRTSLLCKKLFVAGIAKCREQPDGSLEATLRGQELREILNRKNGSFYDQIKEVVYPMSNDSGKKKTLKPKSTLLDWRIAYVNDEEKKVSAINVITDASFEDGVLNISFNKKISKYINNLKGDYTTYLLSEAASLKSTYSFSLLEVLKSDFDNISYKNPNPPPYTVEYDIVDLKFILGVADLAENPEIRKAMDRGEKDLFIYDDKLQGDTEAGMINTYKFRTYALDGAVKEINEKTRLYVEYDTLKGGRGGKIQKIRFRLYPNKNNSKAKETVIEDKVNSNTATSLIELAFKVKEFIKEDLSPSEIEAILKAADYDMEKIQKAYACALSNGTDIKNLTAWLITAIKENYELPVSKKGNMNNRFKNFSEREYEDMDDIETELLAKSMSKANAV